MAPNNERRKSIAADAAVPAIPSTQRRKSIIPSSITTTNAADRRKSTMTPSSSPSPTQRRKSVVADALPQTKKRPTSLLQNTTNASRTGTIPNSKSTVVPNRKSIVPPKQSVNAATIKRARSSTQSSSPVSILKSRTPITAPTTPDNMLDDDQDEEIRQLELEQAEFDNLCQENTNANSAIVSSPVSLEKEDVDDEDDIEDEPIIEQIQQPPPQQPPQQVQQEPVYGSLASSRPISKSDQV